MRLHSVVAVLVFLGCLVPALACVIGAVMAGGDRDGLRIAALAFLIVSIPVAAAAGRGFARHGDRAGGSP